LIVSLFFIQLLQVIIVPFLDGLVGAEVPAYTWFGAVLSLLGVAMLELSGSPPCVSWIIYMDRLTCLSGPSVYFVLLPMILGFFVFLHLCFSILRILKCFKN
jgi:hypothetical protein